MAQTIDSLHSFLKRLYPSQRSYRGLSAHVNSHSLCLSTATFTAELYSVLYDGRYKVNCPAPKIFRMIIGKGEEVISVGRLRAVPLDFSQLFTSWA